MADAAVVARAAQAVVIQQRRVAHSEVLFFGQVLERRRQTVGAVLLGESAGTPNAEEGAGHPRTETLRAGVSC